MKKLTLTLFACVAILSLNQSCTQSSAAVSQPAKVETPKYETVYKIYVNESIHYTTKAITRDSATNCIKFQYASGGCFCGGKSELQDAEVCGSYSIETEKQLVEK